MLLVSLNPIKALNPVNSLTAGITIGIAGLTLVGWAVTLLYLGKTASGWPIIQGIVEESILQDHHEPETGGWTFKIVYRYLWQGEYHLGRRIHFGIQKSMMRQEAEAMASRYVVGCPVMVYCHPRLHIAVLQPGYAQSTGFLLITGLFLLVVGFKIALVG
jgi:hypothetical protein